MISVVIPTYKNKELLLKNLKSNIPFLKGCEIIVINDYPGDNLQADLKDLPITFIENKKNLGFGKTVNEGVKQSTNPYIMLLNSDVVLKDSSYMKALDTLKKDSNCFAVGFAQIEKDGNTVGRNEIFFKQGLVYHRKIDSTVSGKTGWAEGGSCMMRKNLFEELQGFDELYYPFYWEDIDLSYRAQKHGYHVQFNADIVVEHHHESTIKTYFQKNMIETTSFTHQLIFMWKNCTQISLILQHMLFLPYYLLYFALKGTFSFHKGFLKALSLLPTILKKRSVVKKEEKRTDSEVLSDLI